MTSLQASSTQRFTIAVDLTPMLPGGENGGAKPMILALLRHLPMLMSDCKFVLLTSSNSHDELAFLDRPNLSRLCVRQIGPEQIDQSSTSIRIRMNLLYHLYQRAKRFFPGWMILYLKKLAYRITKPANLLSPALLRRLNASLLFCPFTAPVFSEPQIPTVSILHDLQFKSYPHFFSPEDLSQREKNFQEAVHKANLIITVSDFVRGTVLEYSEISSSQVLTIHHGHVQDFLHSDELPNEAFLQQLELKPRQYLLFPANFWQHKNHAMLLTAFRLFLEEHPESELKLVCTGALDNRRSELIRAVQIMGMENRIIFPGFLPSSEIGVLYHYALALIFPSLYEGFGIPLLEAFSAGIPVLCSNITSLPEVGGDAVLHFDPFKPREIANAIAKISGDPSLREELVIKGKRRLEHFGDGERMAHQYATILLQVLEADSHS